MDTTRISGDSHADGTSRKGRSWGRLGILAVLLTMLVPSLALGQDQLDSGDTAWMLTSTARLENLLSDQSLKIRQVLAAQIMKAPIRALCG